ncbi:protein Star [Eurytemora carolleeae]|uniref:protein Star n=1 Tax=Eurytemora carolleeae TaxID=1294199 RepID=UPI000C77F10D|nr:protein Star [Eurytemora carolleeae]|eukprot:XP_023336634.1 protein Star-like [Eurytemora affinis]
MMSGLLGRRWKGYGILLFTLALGFFILTRLDRSTLQDSNRDSHKDSEQSDRHSAVKSESGEDSTPGWDLEQENPRLIERISDVILPAADPKSILKISKEIQLGQVGQIEHVVSYFKNKKGGFFLEAGAFDGEYLSNTLYLEAQFNWTGILIEPNREAFKTLITRNRKSKLLNSCLSVHRYSEEVTFDAADVVGGILGDGPDTKGWVPADKRAKYRLRCFPLYSIIMALGNPKIDFMSLDIEGVELAVLETIPWSKVDIETLLIEVEHSNSAAISSILQSHGYRIDHMFGKQDIFYVKY